METTQINTSRSRVHKTLELSKPLLQSNIFVKSSQSLYSYWRFSELLTGILALFTLVLATIDYELNYDTHRNYNYCQNLDYPKTYRYLILCSSIVALASFIFRFYAKRKWELCFLQSAGFYPINIPVFDQLEPNRPYKFWTSERVCDILILLINPYPFFNFGVEIPQRVHYIDSVEGDYQTKYICYSISELLYVMMFLKIWLLIKALFNYTVYQNDISKLYCRKFHVSANRRFTFKSLMKRYPTQVIVALIFTTFVWISLCLRVLERPYIKVSGFDFEAPTAAMWCVVVTLSTIGYGDIVPKTSLGQMLISLTIIWGALLFSLSVVVLSKELNMTNRQNTAFQKIKEASKAATLIAAGYRYHLVKKEHGAHDIKALEYYSALRWQAKNFRQFMDKMSEITNEQVNEKLGKRINKLESLLVNLTRKIDFMAQNSRRHSGIW